MYGKVCFGKKILDLHAKKKEGLVVDYWAKSIGKAWVRNVCPQYIKGYLLYFPLCSLDLFVMDIQYFSVHHLHV